MEDVSALVVVGTDVAGGVVRRHVLPMVPLVQRHEPPVCARGHERARGGVAGRAAGSPPCRRHPADTVTVMSERTDHYFSAEPATPEERRSIEVTLGGRPLTLSTARGVYSPERLDPGTAVLLAGAPAPAGTGDLLDIGCGWGPISITLALRSPRARVWGVDVNRRALALARDNAAAAGVRNVTFCEPDALPDDVRFTTIWSNPPIHVGKAGPARHPRTMAPAAGRRRRGPSRRAEAPRLRLAPDVGERAGLGPHVHPSVVGQGLPHPRGAPGLTAWSVPRSPAPIAVRARCRRRRRARPDRQARPADLRAA